jgi:hypothetical protein
LNKNDVVDWLKNNFEFDIDDDMPTTITTNEISAIFYEEYERLDDVNYEDNNGPGYVITLFDSNKSADFEKKWDWWIVEKWHAFDAYLNDMTPMREWCRSNIKMSNWKKEGCCFKFKNIEDFNAFSSVFGEEYKDDYDAYYSHFENDSGSMD